MTELVAPQHLILFVQFVQMNLISMARKQMFNTKGNDMNNS